MLTQMITSNVIFARAIYDADYIPPHPLVGPVHPCIVAVCICTLYIMYLCVYIAYLYYCYYYYYYMTLITFLPTHQRGRCILVQYAQFNMYNVCAELCVLRWCVFVHLCMCTVCTHC